MHDFLKPIAALSAAILMMIGETVLSSDPPVKGDKAEAWLEHIRHCSKDMKSIRADFVQERIHPLGPKTSVMKGTLEARRDGRFRMTYTEPSSRLIVSDGETLWAYNPGDETVVKSPASTSLLARLLRYFVDEGDTTAFSARYMGGNSRPDNGERAAIELIPKTRDRFVESIVLTVVDTCPAVTRVVVAESNGPGIRVSIDNIQINPGIGNLRFVFVKPKGARIIEP